MSLPAPVPPRNEAAASTAIITFAVVVLIYSIGFALFLSYTHAPPSTRDEGPNLDAKASGQLAEWVRATGWATVGGAKTSWAQSPDQLTVFGLATDGQPGIVDVAKLAKLNLSGLDASANNYLDYKEALAASDLAGYDFHLRTRIASSANGTGPRLGGVPLAYVANTSWVSTDPGGAVVANGTHYPVNTTGPYSTIKDMGNFVYINVTVRNNGTTNTSFQVELRIPLIEAPIFATANTPVLHTWIDPMKVLPNPVCGDVGGTPPYSICQPLPQTVTPAAWEAASNTCTEGLTRTNPCPDGKCTAACPENYTARFRVNKTATWAWADPTDTKAYLSIYDPHKRVADFTLNFSSALQGPSGALNVWSYSSISMTTGCTPSPCAGHAAITSRIDRPFFGSTETPLLGFDVINATGARVLNEQVNVTIRNSTTQAIVAFWQGPTVTDNRYALSGPLPVGGYNVTVSEVNNQTFNQTDFFNVTDELADEGGAAQEFLSVFVSPGSGASFNHHATPPRGVYSAGASDEIASIASLVDSVSAYADSKGNQANYSSSLGPPSVRDLASSMGANAFGIIVVGSGAQQGGFNAAALRDAVTSFTNSGGLVVVLGSNDAYVTWPDLLVNATSRSQLPTTQPNVPTPGTRHSLLTSPYTLDFLNWTKPAGAWFFRTSTDASTFVTVLSKDGSVDHPVLGLNKSGTVGLGMFILTTVQPAQIETPQNESEQGKFWTNVLGYYLAPLSIDFGPPVPSSETVGVTSRVAATNFGPTKLLLRLDLFVFR